MSAFRSAAYRENKIYFELLPIMSTITTDPIDNPKAYYMPLIDIFYMSI